MFEFEVLDLPNFSSNQNDTIEFEKIGDEKFEIFFKKIDGRN